VVRERSAKPLCVGSIPTRASSLLLQLLVRVAVKADLTFRAACGLDGAELAKFGPRGGQKADTVLILQFGLPACSPASFSDGLRIVFLPMRHSEDESCIALEPHPPVVRSGQQRRRMNDAKEPSLPLEKISKGVERRRRGSPNCSLDTNDGYLYTPQD
jgi:hypothetical protein